MKKVIPILLATTGLIAMSSCVPQKDYNELKAAYEAMEAERYGGSGGSGRSMPGDTTNLTCEEMRVYLQEAWRENESLRSTNININRSYQELMARFSAIVNDNREIFNANSEQSGDLRNQLSQQQLALQERERYLQSLEQELQGRMQQMQSMESGYSQLQGQIGWQAQRIMQLRAELANRNQQLTQTKSTLNADLQSMIGSDLSVTERDGRIYISFSDELLFKTGSAKLGKEGKNAIDQVARALQRTPGFNFVVEGHTDNTGSESKNWQLSLDRANEVVQELISAGLSPQFITAAGRSSYSPVATNSTSEGRALNRRTEIILLPDNTRINDLIYNN